MNPFMFEFYANAPKAESLTNNGHSITFTLKAQREITYPKVGSLAVTNPAACPTSNKDMYLLLNN